MSYPIVVYGHSALRKKAREVEVPAENTTRLVDNLFETMYQAEGMGLAAPQIGKSLRVFVVDGSPLGEDEPSMKDFKKAFINPRITKIEGDEVLMSEGCLSIPRLREEVARKSKINIEYQDLEGNSIKEEYTGYTARVIQHEYDHLEGVLFTDKVSPIRKRLIRGKLNNLSRGKFKTEYRTKLPNGKIW